jgi:hypothetical protein
MACFRPRPARKPPPALPATAPTTPMIATEPCRTPPLSLRYGRRYPVESPRPLDRLRLAAVLDLTSFGLRSLRRLTGSSGRPLSVPPCCLPHRAFARGGSGGSGAPHLPARVSANREHARFARGSRQMTPARFLVPEPAGRATVRLHGRPVSPVGARWRLCPQGQPPSDARGSSTAATAGSEEHRRVGRREAHDGRLTTTPGGKSEGEPSAARRTSEDGVFRKANPLDPPRTTQAPQRPKGARSAASPGRASG